MSNIIFFFVPFAVGIAIMLVLLEISKRTYFLMDKPDGDPLKIHKKSIPLVGGLAIAISFLVSLLFFEGLALAGVALSMLMVCALGFYDDWKWKHILTIKPMLKFTLLIFCTLIPAIILSVIGIAFNFFPLHIISVLLTFIYIFGAINAVNYQDGMDGLAGGQVFIALAGFAFLSLASFNTGTLAISLIGMGAVGAFLVFNLPPAKVFMGDSGSYSLGFILALLAMSFSRPYDIFSVIGPVFIIGLPVFDGIFTNVRRIANGKSIFLGDRSHFYDRLLQKGFSTKKTLAICYSLQIVSVLVGVIIYLWK
ncbi:undecaprenyl/decaprenyl-phosphate alpha-N-acetylglucosaminyl 1-phosphate transferase [Candidatus Parcubacteria bacterium]|nr:undecaprenyl/decaprenyl-phosphate alpha-N-acetylglucosaminyl 1-phosphate transferase [Candidatus Parcubacteria bacterium]